MTQTSSVTAAFTARVTRNPIQTILATALLLSSANTANAQSAQRLSVQMAGLSTAIAGQDGSTLIRGFGVEPQIRLSHVISRKSFGSLSIGLGGQWTTHDLGLTAFVPGDDKVSVVGAFLEPRWLPALSSQRVFPYLAARLAFLRRHYVQDNTSDGSAIGGGGGIAIRVSRLVNIDAGFAMLRQRFSKETNIFIPITLPPPPFQGASTLESAASKIGSTAQVLGTRPFTSYAAKIGVNIGFW